ncbi:MAG: DUF3878 family protein [Clostridia bacterium]|nr:DUF3878 family protein [Clostridia bacterium]
MEHMSRKGDLLKKAVGLIGTVNFYIEKTDEHTAVLTFEKLGCFSCELTLFSCRFEPDFEDCHVSECECFYYGNGKENFIRFSDFCLEKEGNEKIVTVFFESAKEKFCVFNAFKSVGFFSNEPWRRLCDVCGAITEKGQLVPELLNARENETFQLVSFIFAIGNPVAVGNFKVSDDFYKLVKEVGSEKAKKLLDKLAFSRGKKTIQTAFELFFELNKAENENLFRKVSEIIFLSQKDYSSFAEENEKLFEKVIKKREEITKTFHALGYTGEYPSFSKQKDIKLSSFNSYGLTYSLINEKNVFCTVDFFETSPDEKNVIITALSGTMTSKGKTAKKTDALSCFFNTKGKSHGECTSFVISQCDDVVPCSARSADSFSMIAAKRAELKRLSKSEAEYSQTRHLSFWIYLFMGLFFGIGFSVLFTPAMMVFSSIVEHVPFIEMAKDPLWKEIFLFCFLTGGILFPIAMFIAERIASKK